MGHLDKRIKNEIADKIIADRDIYGDIYGDIQRMFFERFGVLVAYHRGWMAKTKEHTSIHEDKQERILLAEIIEWCIANRTDYNK